jgi:hypothetical protein
MNNARTSANTSALHVEARNLPNLATAERGQTARLFLSKPGKRARRASRQNVRAIKRAWLDS